MPIAANSLLLTPYVDQKGRSVVRCGMSPAGRPVLRHVDGREEEVDPTYMLFPVQAADADEPALPLSGVIGKPRAVIETVISDLTDAQLVELVEADTRLFVEHLVTAEQKRRPLPTPALDLMVGDYSGSTKVELEAARGQDLARAEAEGREAARASLGLSTPTPLLDEAERGAWQAGYISERVRMEETPVPGEQPLADRLGEQVEQPVEQTPAPVEPKRFPRGWCPVCGHEGMLTRSGHIRAHQRDGSPCEGQQALTVQPSAADLLRREVESVPEALPGSIEPNDLARTVDVEPAPPVKEPEAWPEVEPPRSSGRFSDYLEPTPTPPAVEPAPPVLDGMRIRSDVPLSEGSLARLQQIRAHLQTLHDAMPGYLAAVEAVDALADLDAAVFLPRGRRVLADLVRP